MDLAAAQAQHGAHPEFGGDAGEGRLLDQPRAQHRQLAFLGLGQVAEEMVAGDEVDQGIAQEFQALVVGRTRLVMLVDPRAVGQGAQQQPALIETDAESRLECVDGRGSRGSGGLLRHRSLAAGGGFCAVVRLPQQVRRALALAQRAGSRRASAPS